MRTLSSPISSIFKSDSSAPVTPSLKKDNLHPRQADKPSLSLSNLPQIIDEPADEDENSKITAFKQISHAQPLQSAMKSRVKQAIKIEQNFSISQPTQLQPNHHFQQSKPQQLQSLLSSSISDQTLQFSKGALESKREAAKMKDKFSSILNSQQLVDEEGEEPLIPTIISSVQSRPLTVSKETARQLISKLNLAQQSSSSSSLPYQLGFGMNSTERTRTQPNASVDEERSIVSSEIPKVLKREMKKGSLSISSLKLKDTNPNLNIVLNSSKQSDQQKQQSQQLQQQRSDLQKSPSVGLFLSSRLLFKSSASSRTNLASSQSGGRVQTSSSKSSSTMTEFIPNFSKPGSKGQNPSLNDQASLKNRFEGISNVVTPRREVYSSGTLSQHGSRDFKFKKIVTTEESPLPQQATLTGYPQTADKRISITNQTQRNRANITSVQVVPEQRPTPLLSQIESETNWKVKHSQSLNNVYLKMLDEFQIPYEQDFDKIRKKISEMQIAQEAAVDSSSSSAPIDKKFIMNLLQSQLELKKTEFQKARQLRVPTNRYDVEVLKHWLDFMVFKIYSEEVNSGQELLSKIQSVLESGFQEILKQVSIDCQTRGDLLQKVWRNQNSLNIRQIEEQQRLRRETEQEGLDEITRIHKMYSTEINKFIQETDSLLSEKKAMQEKFEIMKTNLKYLKKNNMHLQKQSRQLKDDLEFLQKKNSDLEYAQSQLKREYMNLSNTHQSIQLSKEDREAEIRLAVQAQQKMNQKPKSTHSIQLKQNKPASQKPISMKHLSNVPGEQLKTVPISIPAQFSEQIQKEIDDDSSDDQNEQQQPSSHHLSKQNLFSQQDIVKNNLQNPGIQIQTPEITKSIQTPRNGEIKQQNTNKLNNLNLSNSFDDLEDDSDLFALVVVDKAVDTLDWNSLFTGDLCLQTEFDMKDNQSDKNFQVDFKVDLLITETEDKETQTTELDPEQQDRMKGMNIQKLEKNMDHLNRIEHELQSNVEKFQMPYEIKKTVYEFLKQLNRNADSVQSMLKEEIGLKEQYHKEIINFKLASKENQLKSEEMSLKVEKLEETNRSLTTENSELTHEIASLHRRTKKLNTHLEKVSAAQTMIYAETSKFAENMHRSSFMANLVDKAISPQNQDITNSSIELIEDTKEKQPVSKDPGSTSLADIPIDPIKKQLGKIASLSPQRAVKAPSSQPQTKNVLLKIQNAVKELIHLDLGKRNDQSSSSDSSDNDEPYISKAPNNQGQPLSPTHRSSSNLKKKVNRSDSNLSFTASMMSSSKMSMVFDKPAVKTASYKFNEPKFERKRMMKITSQHITPSLNLFNKLQKRIAKVSAKMTMTRKNVCKYISLIYNERMKNETNRNDPFHVCCYEFFMSHFGLKKVAESKIIQLYEAIYFFRSKSPRVKLFGRFLNLFDAYSVDELDYYLNSLQKLDEESPAFTQCLSNTSEIVVASFEKVLAFLKRTDDGTGSMEKSLNLIQKYKVPHRQNTNYLVVDIDLIFEGVLESYKKVKMSNKGLENLFYSGDLDKDGMIGFYEFICLCKYIEQMHEGSEKLIASERLFFLKCDLIHSDTGEKALSLEQFVSMATQTGLFSQSKINAFEASQMALPNCQTFQSLKKKHVDILQQLKMRFYKANSFNPFLATSIRKLSELLQSTTATNGIDQEKEQLVWFSYQILDLESKHVLLLSEIQECLPQPFIDILINSKEQTEEPGDEFCAIDFASNFKWA